MRASNVSVFIVLGAMLAVPMSTARADTTPPTVDTCVSAHEKAQVERRARHYVAAKTALTFCAQKGCPAIARHDCTAWLTEIDAQLPTVVFEPRADGKLVHDVKVSVDGTEVLDHIEDGTQVPLDPGAHQIRFERQGWKPALQEILIVAGEKNRRVSTTLEPEGGGSTTVTPPAKPTNNNVVKQEPDTRSETPKSAEIPTATWVFAGLAVVGFAGFTIFGLRGLTHEEDLRSSGCMPYCSPSNIQYVDTQYLIADVSLVLGILSAGAAGWLFFTRGNR